MACIPESMRRSFKVAVVHPNHLRGAGREREAGGAAVGREARSLGHVSTAARGIQRAGRRQLRLEATLRTVYERGEYDGHRQRS